MKTKFLVYGITVVIVTSLFCWKALLADASDEGWGGSGSSYRSSGPGSGSWSSGGHK